MSADSATGIPLFLLSVQVRGLLKPHQNGEVLTFGLELDGCRMIGVQPTG